MKTKLKEALLSTLVIENKQSIDLCVDKLCEIINKHKEKVKSCQTCLYETIKTDICVGCLLSASDYNCWEPK